MVKYRGSDYASLFCEFSMLFILGSCIVFYIIPTFLSLRLAKLQPRLHLIDESFCPVINLIFALCYIVEELPKEFGRISEITTAPKGALSGYVPPTPENINKIAEQQRAYARKIEKLEEIEKQLKSEEKVKKLVKRVEPVPATMKLEISTKVVTYRLANDTEVVERFEITPKPTKFLYFTQTDCDVLFHHVDETLRFAPKYHEVISVPMDNFELGQIIENPPQYRSRTTHMNAYVQSNKSDLDYKKDFIGENGEYFRVMSFKIETEVEEVEIEYNNFRVVAREVEV